MCIPSSTLQIAQAPYRFCPLLSHFEYTDRQTCSGISQAGHFSPQNCPFTCRDLDPHRIRFLGPTWLHIQMASRLVQLFLHSSWQTLYFTMGHPFPPQKLPCAWVSRPLHGSSGPPESTPKQHLDRFTRFFRAHDHNRPTEKQTNSNRSCYSISNNRLHLRSTVMRPNNNKWLK